MNPQMAIYLFAFLVTLTGCAAKRVITVEEVNKMVSSRLSIGSTKEEVAQFIESLRIDSLRVTHGDFQGVDRLRWDNFDDIKRDALGDKLHEFYDAAIRDIAPSSGTFEGIIKMRFYFDQNGKLMDYTIKEETGFR